MKPRKTNKNAFLGLFIMIGRLFAGDQVSLSDFGIQSTALIIFGTLIFKDRSKKD